MSSWLYALLGLCFTNFAVSITGIVLMFLYYTDGCDDSTTFVSLALIFIVILTVLQLTSDPEHGHNLLVSASFMRRLSVATVPRSSHMYSRTHRPRLSSLSRLDLIRSPLSSLSFAQVTSVVSAYITYLTYVGVSSNPNGSCNPNYSEVMHIRWLGVLSRAGASEGWS